MDRAQAFDFAKKIAEDDPSAAQQLAEFAWNAEDFLFDLADRTDNTINMVTMGDVPSWLSTEIPETNLTLFSALGYVATCRNLMKISFQEASGKGADKGEILNLIRDVATKVTTYWADALTTTGSGALSLGMSGAFIIDKMLTAFAEEAKATRMEDITFVYHHYNESFTGFGHKPMKAKDWRAKVIQVIDKYPNDPEIAIEALEAGFRAYASEFFDLTAEQMYEVASDVSTVTVRRIPNFTESEKNQMIEDYVAHLKDKTMPAVLTSVSNYMVRKAEQAELDAMNRIKDYYNTKISIVMKEEIPEGGTSQYKGYRFRIEPLNGRVEASSWTGIWPESGSGTGSATLLGFLLAGFPHTLCFYKPDADPDKTEPELTVPFVIQIPRTEITFEGKQPLAADAFMGEWVDDKGRRMLLIANGGTVICMEPDLPWYGGDIVCIEYRIEESDDPQSLLLKGITSWVSDPDYYGSPSAKRRLEIDASSASLQLTATKVQDGVILEMTGGSVVYRRP